MTEEYGFTEAFTDLNELGFSDLAADERGKAHRRLAEFMLELEMRLRQIEESVE